MKLDRILEVLEKVPKDKRLLELDYQLGSFNREPVCHLGDEFTLSFFKKKTTTTCMIKEQNQSPDGGL